MQPLRYKVHSVESIKSTNTALKALAKDGAPEGYVLVASSQTNGRGRLNRVFFSPKGTGLYVSILLRPSCRLEPYALTCMAAVALHDTLSDFQIESQIKWVNDLYIDGKKASGILVESALNQDGSFQYSVVGIGVNLFFPKDGFPDTIADKATAVFDDPPNEERRKQFLKQLLIRFKRYYEQLPEITFYDTDRDHLLGVGAKVLVSEPDGMHYGTAVGIDRSFRLLVRYDDGSETALDRGDVTFL